MSEQLANAAPITQERGKTHGNWEKQSEATNAIRNLIVMHAVRNNVKLHPSQFEVLSMLATKIGRIVAGDPNFVDHWLDIEGYASLERARLEKQALHDAANVAILAAGSP